MEYLDITTVTGKNPDGTLITEVVTEPVYNVNDFPYRKFVTSQLVRKKDKVYYNIPCTFDIESSTLEPPKRKIHRRNGKIDEEYEFTPYGFMYQWQFCICDCVVFGRRWEEFQTLLNNLQRELRLYNGKKLIIYVHFLAYEFQFIKDFLDIESIFAKEKRKPMKIETSSFEFRCSYFLSNMSLSKFCENTEGCKYWKKKIHIIISC